LSPNGDPPFILHFDGDEKTHRHQGAGSDSFRPFHLIKCDIETAKMQNKRLNFQFAPRAPFGLDKALTLHLRYYLKCKVSASQPSAYGGIVVTSGHGSSAE